jgi:uncharacterized membrane protein
MGQLSKVQVQLLSGLLQPLFYGIYIVTLAWCLKALFRQRRETETTVTIQWRKLSDMNKPMLIVAVLMAIIATLDLIVTFVTGWSAFTSVNMITNTEDLLETHTGWLDIVGVGSECLVTFSLS